MVKEITKFDCEVERILQEVAKLLSEKNKKYGNSALDPLRCFSKSSPTEQIKVRIDDKLSRIRNGVNDAEDTILDLIGYLIILRIATKEKGANKTGEKNGINNKN